MELRAKKHLVRDPELPYTLTHLARSYWELGRYAEAAQTYERALAINCVWRCRLWA